MMWIEIFGLILIAYLIGSIPTAVWVSKGFYGKDVREHGSGNAGATNTIRVLGYTAGIPVLLFDVFKGWLAVQLAVWISFPDITVSNLTYVEIGCAVAAVLGHIFPLFAGFRGGKGVGTLAGVGLALYPISLLVVLGIFILTLALTRYVSLSSILGAVSFPFVVYFIAGEHNLALLGLAVFVAVFIPLTHMKNIKRLLKGEENRFIFRRKKS
ncbi:MAG: glycerol-3-phosphate 1-O-acyltransferase PlsY [Bacteroidales bacterium]|nr:glycerol-3-phosphate 1-O-acyltransferase PlsY [Bacteroidales bacterium]